MKDSISWLDITLKQYEQLREVQETSQEDLLRQVAIICYGEEVEDLPVNKYIERVNNIHLSGKIPTVKCKSEYIINGHTYKFSRLETPKTSQYLDFCNYNSNPSATLEHKLSCFMIPEGHTYGDGYDIQPVLDDMEDMLLVDVQAVTNFFQLSSKILSLIFLRSLAKQIRKNKTLTKEQKKKALQTIQASNSLESSLSFLNIVKQPTILSKSH